MTKQIIHAKPVIAKAAVSWAFELQGDTLIFAPVSVQQTGKIVLALMDYIFLKGTP